MINLVLAAALGNEIYSQLRNLFWATGKCRVLHRQVLHRISYSFVFVLSSSVCMSLQFVEIVAAVAGLRRYAASS